MHWGGDVLTLCAQTQCGYATTQSDSGKYMSIIFMWSLSLEKFLYEKYAYFTASSSKINWRKFSEPYVLENIREKDACEYRRRYRSFDKKIVSCTTRRRGLDRFGAILFIFDVLAAPFWRRNVLAPTFGVDVLAPILFGAKTFEGRVLWRRTH